MSSFCVSVRGLFELFIGNPASVICQKISSAFGPKKTKISVSFSILLIKFAMQKYEKLEKIG